MAALSRSASITDVLSIIEHAAELLSRESELISDETSKLHSADDTPPKETLKSLSEQRFAAEALLLACHESLLLSVDVDAFARLQVQRLTDAVLASAMQHRAVFQTLSAQAISASSDQFVLLLSLHRNAASNLHLAISSLVKGLDVGPALGLVQAACNECSSVTTEAMSKLSTDGINPLFALGWSAVYNSHREAMEKLIEAAEATRRVASAQHLGLLAAR